MLNRIFFFSIIFPLSAGFRVKFVVDLESVFDILDGYK